MNWFLKTDYLFIARKFLLFQVYASKFSWNVVIVKLNFKQEDKKNQVRIAVLSQTLPLIVIALLTGHHVAFKATPISYLCQNKSLLYRPLCVTAHHKTSLSL